jgi:polar amino acid transport system ATP-binding protein
MSPLGWQYNCHPNNCGERQMTHEMQVEIDRVTKKFGIRTVLDDISLRVETGETVALIGPSGAGKSTLLRCINGLNMFDGGEIRVGPFSLLPQRNHHGCPNARQVRRLFGMIFQDFQLFPHLTALENIMEAPCSVLKLPRADARERALTLLRRVGLADRADAYPLELSGGQKQRVAIARAMAMEPRGLLCDEITSALDPELKGEVLAVLEDLKRDGLTLILVTHEIGFARRAADRVVVLADGKIVESGPPSQVLDNSQAPRTKQFLSQMLI